MILNKMLHIGGYLRRLPDDSGLGDLFASSTDAVRGQLILICDPTCFDLQLRLPAFPAKERLDPVSRFLAL